MAKLKITQTGSTVGALAQQKGSLRSLGLHRIGESTVKEDRPEYRGMIQTVAHLVTVEEVD